MIGYGATQGPWERGSMDVTRLYATSEEVRTVVTRLYPDKTEGRDYDIIRVDLSPGPSWFNIPEDRITVLAKP